MIGMMCANHYNSGSYNLFLNVAHKVMIVKYGAWHTVFNQIQDEDFFFPQVITGEEKASS